MAKTVSQNKSKAMFCHDWNRAETPKGKVDRSNDRHDLFVHSIEKTSSFLSRMIRDKFGGRSSRGKVGVPILVPSAAKNMNRWPVNVSVRQCLLSDLPSTNQTS